MLDSEHLDFIATLTKGRNPFKDSPLVKFTCPYCNAEYRHKDEKRAVYGACPVCKGNAKLAALGSMRMRKVMDNIEDLGFIPAIQLLQHIPEGYFETELVRRIARSFPEEWEAMHVST